MMWASKTTSKLWSDIKRMARSENTLPDTAQSLPEPEKCTGPASRHLPGQKDPYMQSILQKRSAAMMATEALQALPFKDLCDVVEASIEARPDASHTELANLAQTLDRRAWAMISPE